VRPSDALTGALILDFDGTILDTEGPVYEAWRELWEACGVTLEREFWQSLIGTEAGFDPWAALVDQVGPLDPTLQDHRRARRDELQALESVRPGVLDWLEQASSLGLPVGIASSSPAEWVVGHLSRIGLLHRFGCICCVSEEVPAKPDPALYLSACDGLGAAPGLSVAVEDSPHGVASARAAGLYVIAVPHDLTADLDLSAADMVVGSLVAVALSDALGRAAARSGLDR
jgi:HAD superfamily hydrolase (TIGR01509 family)